MRVMLSYLGCLDLMYIDPKKSLILTCALIWTACSVPGRIACVWSRPAMKVSPVCLTVAIQLSVLLQKNVRTMHCQSVVSLH